jgi:hypothetical protein
VELYSVHLEIALIMTRDRGTVCNERTIGSSIVLDAPDGTYKGRGSCGISFSQFGERVSVSAR